MHSAKFIEVLRTFTPAEFRSFRLLVNSPYFNSEKIPAKLFEVLKKHYPVFTSQGLKKEKVFVKLYPGKTYNDAVMRGVFSDMLKLIENFLLFENFKKDEFKMRVQLMDEFSKRKLLKLYEKNLNKAETILNAGDAHDIEYYRNKLRIEQSKRVNEIIHKDIYVNTQSTEQLISDITTLIFLMEMIFKNLQLINLQKKNDYKYDLNFEEEIDRFLEGSGSKYLDNNYIKYYYYTFRLLRTNDEKYYILLKEFADSGSGGLSLLEIRDIYTALLNYCYFKLSSGEDNFIRELFLLITKMIEKNVYTNQAGNIPNVFFMNAVTTGLESGEISWVEKFIAEKGELLKDDSKIDTLNFCRANLSYFKKEYDLSLKYLAMISTDDMSYKLNIRSVYLKLYFDMNEIEPFLSHVDTYRHFMSGNRLVPEHLKDPVNNYINFTNRIFFAKNKIGKHNEYDLPVLKREIKESKILINRPWLLKKIEEIEHYSI